ncbi:MAG: class I tRNA ligase family protein [Ignavibacteria bacterium]
MKEKVKTDGTEQSDKYVNDLTDKWLESRYNSSLKNADRFLHEYRIDEYTKTLYNFVWSDYCDWYIELMKIKINEYPEQSGRIISDAIDYYENILKILHPVIPYVTEELWHNLKEGRAEKSISIEMLPDINESKIDPDQEIKFEKVKEIASAIRNLKAVNNIPASFRSEVFIISSGDSKKLISEYRMYIEKLCNLEKLESVEDVSEDERNYAKAVAGNYEIFLSIEKMENSEEQIEKIKKDLENLKSYLSGLDKKLSNENFLSKAAPDVISREKQKQQETSEKIEKLTKLI